MRLEVPLEILNPMSERVLGSRRQREEPENVLLFHCPFDMHVAICGWDTFVISVCCRKAIANSISIGP